MQAHHQKFRFVENSGKIPEILCKIPENLGKNDAQPCFDFKIWRPTFTDKQTKTLFLEVTQKKLLMVFVGENLLWAKNAQLLGKFGEIRAKISLAPPNIWLLLLHLWSGKTTLHRAYLHGFEAITDKLGKLNRFVELTFVPAGLRNGR